MNRIEQGQHLLKMIENVDVNDTDALDEINARAACFLDGDRQYVGIYLDDISTRQFVYEAASGNQYCDPIYTYYYTSSLDALHDAMPDGFRIDKIGQYMNNDFRVSLWRDTYFYSPHLPTMHLAWLHAIIQAYIYMEENDG